MRSKNNNRNWFNANKDEYVTNHEQMISFAESVLEEMHKHDKIETVSGKKSLHRIYRDIRFSKDKSPYKNHWGGGFKRATKLLRGGYYYHIEPGNTIVAGGFWGPDKEDLARIMPYLEGDLIRSRGYEKINPLIREYGDSCINELEGNLTEGRASEEIMAEIYGVFQERKLNLENNIGDENFQFYVNLHRALDY